MLKFYVKVFYVMGKAVSGELSFHCDRSCFIITDDVISTYTAFTLFQRVRQLKADFSMWILCCLYCSLWSSSSDEK